MLGTGWVSGLAGCWGAEGATSPCSGAVCCPDGGTSGTCKLNTKEPCSCFTILYFVIVIFFLIWGLRWARTQWTRGRTSLIKCYVTFLSENIELKELEAKAWKVLQRKWLFIDFYISISLLVKIFSILLPIKEGGHTNSFYFSANTYDHIFLLLSQPL